MTCGGKKQCSKSKVKREITKQDQSKHGHLKQINVGQGTKEEWAFSAPKMILILYKIHFVTSQSLFCS